MNTPLLQIKDLHTDIEIRNGVVRALSGVDLHVNPGETLGIVGESGSGKTMTALSLMGLLPQGGKVSSGSIILDGQDLTQLDERGLREVRGKRIAMIFQDPMTSLNPVYRVGDQIAEMIRARTRRGRTGTGRTRRSPGRPRRSCPTWASPRTRRWCAPCARPLRGPTSRRSPTGAGA